MIIQLIIQMIIQTNNEIINQMINQMTITGGGVGGRGGGGGSKKIGQDKTRVDKLVKMIMQFSFTSRRRRPKGAIRHDRHKNVVHAELWGRSR